MPDDIIDAGLCPDCCPGDDSITTSCCPSDPTPTILHLSLTAGGPLISPCDLVPQTVPLQYRAGVSDCGAAGDGWVNLQYFWLRTPGSVPGIELCWWLAAYLCCNVGTWNLALQVFVSAFAVTDPPCTDISGGGDTCYLGTSPPAGVALTTVSCSPLHLTGSIPGFQFDNPTPHGLCRNPLLNECLNPFTLNIEITP